MKDPFDRTKVVLRHLPPALTQSALMKQIDRRFAACYNWVMFCPGKTSHKHQIYSRAYIDFKKPDDVVEFAEFFDGHVFVNEKGAQFKTIVEYAPSQRVPTQWSKKDGREGTILKVPSAADGAPGTVVQQKKRVVLLKGKEREITHASGSGSQPLGVTSSLKTLPGASNFKQNQGREGKVIRTILSNKDAQQIQSLTSEKDNRPPRPNNLRSILKDTLSGGSQAACGSDYDSRKATDDKVTLNGNHGFVSGNEKQEKRRNKDRPDRGVWTLRRSEGSHASDESLSSSSSQLLCDSVEGLTLTQHVPVHGITNSGDDAADIGFSNKLGSKPRNLEAAVNNFRGPNSSSAYDHPPNHGEMKVDMPSTSRSEVKLLEVVVVVTLP